MSNKVPEVSNDEQQPEAPEGIAAEETAATGEQAEATVDTAEPVEVEKDPMEVLEEEVAKWKDLALRSKADLENYRKRIHGEKQEAIKYGNSSLLEELIPILDNFDFGLQAALAESEDSQLSMGMKMIAKQFQEFLTRQGVETIDIAAGSEFDPKQHDAVQKQPSDSIEEGKVLQTIRKGYKLRDRLIRAANVTVSSGTATEEA